MLIGVACGHFIFTVFTFLPSVAPGPPRMFQITSVTTTSISFSWQAPAVTNGILTGYQLTCQPELPTGIPSPPTLRTGSTVNTAMLSNLFSGVRYNCSIVARNSEGPSDPVYAVGTTTETGIYSNNAVWCKIWWKCLQILQNIFFILYFSGANMPCLHHTPSS